MPRTASAAPESTPPTLPDPDAIPADLRDRLSPVVMDMYSAGDFHRVDMRSIAREAGMSFRTIYRYFGDKEQLLFWFIAHWLTDLYAGIATTLDEGASAKAQLSDILKVHLDFYEKHPNVGRIIFMTVPLERWMRDSSYAQSDLMRRALSLIKNAQQQGELRSDVDAVVILDAWSALFNRAFLMWEYRRRSYRLSDQAAPLFSILWKGIAGKLQVEPASGAAPANRKKAPARPAR